MGKHPISGKYKVCKMNVSELIMKAREKAGGYEPIAKGLNMSKNRLTDWKAGSRKPDANEIAYLADIAGLPILETVAEVQKEMSNDYADLWEKAANEIKGKSTFKVKNTALRMMFALILFCKVLLMNVKKSVILTPLFVMVR